MNLAATLLPGILVAASFFPSDDVGAHGIGERPPNGRQDVVAQFEAFSQSISPWGLRSAKVAYLLSKRAPLQLWCDVLRNDGLEVDGIKFDYLLVRGSCIVFRFDKSGRFLGAAFSPAVWPPDVESIGIVRDLQGLWKRYVVAVNTRVGEITLAPPDYIYIENNAVILFAGVLNIALPYAIRGTAWSRLLAIDFGNGVENAEFRKRSLLPSEYRMLLVTRNIVLLACWPAHAKEGLRILLLVREGMKNGSP